jgi:hypothetical protein
MTVPGTRPGFEEFRPVFQQELALIDAADDPDYEAARGVLITGHQLAPTAGSG